MSGIVGGASGGVDTWCRSTLVVITSQHITSWECYFVKTTGTGIKAEKMDMSFEFFSFFMQFHFINIICVMIIKTCHVINVMANVTKFDKRTLWPFGSWGAGGGVEHAQHMAVFVLMPAGGCDAV